MIEVVDDTRVGLMARSMLVVKVEEEAVDRVVLLKMTGADVVLRSRVMLENPMEKGTATLMPTARAMGINYNFGISIDN